jgi:enediyne biosynthesis protein E4
MAICLRRAAWIILSVTLGFVLASCNARTTPSNAPSVSDQASEGPVWFEDVTDAVGLDFVHDAGPTGDYFMPQANGSGCAFIHEKDKDSGKDNLYIYLLNSAGPDSKSVNRLYLRTPEGKFKDVTAGSGLDVAGYSQGVAVGDVNNDGLPDVLLTQYGGIKLFLNQGNGKFKDVTVEAGLSNPLWGTSAAFVDYDRDGWLDLVIANYVDYDPKSKCKLYRGLADFCGPNHFPGTCSKLYRNLGATAGPDGKTGVRFADVSVATGIGSKPGPGLGVLCADFDGDGWPDIFIANDEKPNHLWISYRKPDGTVYFKEEAVARGVAYTGMAQAHAGMGIALGDVDNKGMFDLFVTHLETETHTLWKQGPRGQFQDRTLEAGLMRTRWRGTGFGTLMADFDLDGAVDLVIVNGAVSQGNRNRVEKRPFWEGYSQRNQLLANDGTGKFRDLSPSNKALCGRWNVARGLACDDFDGDGAPDLLVTAIGDRARLFRNVAPDRGHWLSVRAFDPVRRRDAYGAEVRIQVADRQMLRLINPAGSFLSSSSPYAFFGLGKADRLDKILVKWPDGPLDEVDEEFDGGPADRHLVLTRGTGRKVQKGEARP